MRQSTTVSSTGTPESASTNPPVEVKGLTKRFKQGSTVVEAIHNVSLTVTPGEFVAIMGASGSGKSTLLHVIAGLTSQDAGDVWIDGTDLSRLSDGRLTRFRRRKIGLVFQQFNLIPSLTAEENVLLPLLSEGSSVREQEEHVLPLLERLGIAHRRRHRPDALSGGEQQRVAIARALITNPAVVLADEPTGSLDSTSGQKICGLLRELCEEQQRTIIVVTHEASVAQWSQRIVVMKDGQKLTEFMTAEFSTSQALALHYQQVANQELTAIHSR